MPVILWLVTVVAAYTLGWRERGEHERALNNVDRLAQMALRGLREGERQ